MARRPAPARKRRAPPDVVQFLVVLAGTDPLVWRRIQVPERYSFWDLHVAIQDAMGWKDCHLHEFLVMDSRTARGTRIGIPDEDFPDERPTLPGWEVPITPRLTHGSEPARYRYDFGDDWNHLLVFEDMLPSGGGRSPRCIAGAGACPPEDVGGTHGYAEFLRVVADPHHPEHQSMLTWAGGAFDPHAFEPTRVQFDDPGARWEHAFAPPDDPRPRPRTKIAAGQAIPVALTERERDLVLAHTFGDPDLARAFDAANRQGTTLVVDVTLDDLDDLLGHVAAAANHCEKPKLRRELQALHERLADEMERWDDGQ
ncbi:MAG: plasmid pRiA4b ORF-3 family protein [Candidatus Binatia bacterium]